VRPSPKGVNGAGTALLAMIRRLVVLILSTVASLPAATKAMLPLEVKETIEGPSMVSMVATFSILSVRLRLASKRSSLSSLKISREKSPMNNLEERIPVPNSIQESSEDLLGFIYPTYQAAPTSRVLRREDICTLRLCPVAC